MDSVSKGFFIAVLLCLALLSQPLSAANTPISLPKNATAIAPAIQKSANDSLGLFFKSMTTFTGMNSSELAGVQLVGLLSLLGAPQANTSPVSGALPAVVNNSSIGGMLPIPSAQSMLPNISAILSQLRLFILFCIAFCYIFAAGKIAEFLQLSGKAIAKREALAAPLAYVAAGILAVFIYYFSGKWVPPQNTIITMAVYLLIVPLAIFILCGAAVLYAFFKDRLNVIQSLDMSMKIVLAPLFDGLSGYWTALGAAAALAAISSFSFYSSGGNLSLVTLDFFLLSIVVALYFVYRSLTSRGSEAKAADFVTALCILAPSILQAFFKDLFCAAFKLIPIAFFKTCPLNQMDSGATLGVSIAATMILLVPVVPFIYAGAVNLLRASALFAVIMQKEPPRNMAKQEENDADEDEGIRLQRESGRRRA